MTSSQKHGANQPLRYGPSRLLGGLKDSLTRRIQTAGIGIDIPDVDPIGEVAPRYRYTDPSLVFLSFSPLNLT
ncbi:hypothetical protein NLI96_g5896 [Meripilus lineatus]|uniref:Uncharacterized protein n=1 Tax=Meripilus lineatus TaxID=2056292 RepID=A0AAD5YIM7_9APHY|nr:hypothetical protein NLI96_g5896 [Physisporinus lineatus]